LPPHQRHSQDDDSGKKISGKAQNIFSRINSDIKALNSSILVISQKIKYLVRNEKILGRNLLVLNKKVKAIQESRQHGSADLSGIQPELEEISRKLSENAGAIEELHSELEYIKENYAKAEEVSEIKFVIGSINPMEFVSINDVNEIVAKAMKKK